MPNVSSSTPPAAQHLNELLELEQLDTNLFRSRVNQVNSNRTLFGGQILGQSLKAAAVTVDPARAPHSLHGYFLLPGASDLPVIYDVELTRDGGSFSTRRVVARQRGKTIFHMECSFHRTESGFEHEVALDAQVPEPDELLDLEQLIERFADRIPQSAAALQGSSIVELKPVRPEDFFLRKAETTRGMYWIRSASKLPDDALTHTAALAYLSDHFLTPLTALRHTVSLISDRVMMASLDHAMWFHRTCRADEWLLVDVLSPFAGGARGFARAQIWNRERRLIASVAQEGLVRPLAEG
ncbi:MAG: acyl-CoA thioesterase II [Gammaproteobacteria bacterium]|nr:acyl-CoA thioesterase II [Gammaproteobacteria bacterium]